MITGFIFGLISSLHCVGMCGPLTLLLPLDKKNEVKFIVQFILYILGKSSTYALFGILFGVIGRGFFLAGLQQNIAIVSGLMLMILAFIPEKRWIKFNFLTPLFKYTNKIKSEFHFILKSKSNFKFYILGFFNGFLPCGLVYLSLFSALRFTTIGEVTLYMFVFGLGTLPLLFLFNRSSNFIKNKWNVTFQKIIPFFIFFIGLMMVLRGLSLNIPYVSPNIINLQVQKQSNCH